MPRVRQLEPGVRGVIDGVDAGDDGDLIESADELVGIGEHVRRREVCTA